MVVIAGAALQPVPQPLVKLAVVTQKVLQLVAGQVLQPVLQLDLQQRCLWQRTRGCLQQRLPASAVEATENMTAAAANKQNARLISHSFKFDTGARPWESRPSASCPLS